MNGAEAKERARGLFLDDRHLHGCAETAFVVLKEAFGLADAADSSAVMALNGGVAYDGGVCGAITGAAVAAGLLAGRLVPDHPAAKQAARDATARLIEEFRCEFGSVTCRRLLGVDIATHRQHEAFIASGIWKTVCMGQIEFAVGRLAGLPDDGSWLEQHAADTAPACAEDPSPAGAEDHEPAASPSLRGVRASPNEYHR